MLSGINHGANLGEDVTYSGTVAAAMEATLFKVPGDRAESGLRGSAQHSLADGRAVRAGGDRAAAGDPLGTGRADERQLPRSRSGRGRRGAGSTTQGKRKIGDTLLERTDPRGEPYLWIGALREDSQPGEGTDLAAIAAGYVSVTPVHLDMTHGPSLDELRQPLSADGAAIVCRFLAQLWRQE